MATHLPLAGGHDSGFGKTHRTDNWRLGPMVTFSVITAAIIYITWAALQGVHYLAGPYLSPLYSPLLFSHPDAHPMITEHAWFGTWPSWWPSFLPASPALLILAAPGAFRFTCYYYRKAYYRAFAGSPPGCAVGPLAKRTYNGETKLMLLQNLHRYALYLALVYVIILYYDAFAALRLNGQWGIGVGTIILFVNATLIAGYTFGCHSFRHLIGGRQDCMTCDSAPTAAYKAWRGATWFNTRHMRFAWLSLIWVCWTDLYVRLVAMGKITDLNTW